MSQQRQRASTKAGTPPLLSSSPIKRQRLGISLEQKQAIIDNLQLELTDRARRLRAQYNQQAQTLRSRIQMRVNRVPRAMLKMTMADLVARAVEQQKRLEGASVPPPVPEKDFPTRASPYKLAPPARSAKRLSDAMVGGDKENEQILNPKKKHRAAPAPLSSSQILSPTSSNTRSLARERPPSSPSKSSQIARPTEKNRSYSSVASPKRLDSQLQRVGTCACYRHRASHENTTGQHHYGSQSAIATWDANRQTSE
ncbi:hypothetical protein QIS74_08956 [Colletotrichum tabaci]|uniref:Borealin N-terminal domain-containing protein n=1 Tax=Colletotrichum tabaci TaxID=1209068 RepID=A0AAV9T405_9PEZI